MSSSKRGQAGWISSDKVLSYTENVQEEPVDILDILSGEIVKMGIPVNNAYLYSMRRQALPIIFVPGIMGSRLYNPTFETNVWDPDAALSALYEAVLRGSPKERYTRLADNAEALCVAENDYEHNKAKFGEQYPHGIKRS